jgi:hypothetical protein
MNVVLVTVDCLRQDRVGIYGHHRDTTPTLDALGREGFVFNNAYATGPVTTESMPGILAGRLSRDCVAANNLYQKRIPDGEPTIASHLRDEGWSTAAVITNPRIGPHVASDRGFETFENLRTTPNESSDDESGSSGLLSGFSVGDRLYNLRERMREFDSVPLRYELPFLGFRTYQYLTGWPSIRGERVVDEFLDVLDGMSSSFFAWTHLMDVHGPIHPQTVRDGGLSDDGLLTQFRSHAKRVSNVHDARTEARYDSAVRYVDDQLTRIVEWLKTNDVWDETALIVTADHGDALCDRGIYGHPQHYLYDELLQVPLIVHTPDRNGTPITYPFSLGWLHEIISELGAVDTLDSPLTSPYENHLEASEPMGEVLLVDSIDQLGHSIAAREGAMKYVSLASELAGQSATNTGPSGYFRVDRDPKERRSFDELIPHLEQLIHDTKIDPNSIRKRAPGTVDDTTLDQLRQLGYAGE